MRKKGKKKAIIRAGSEIFEIDGEFYELSKNEPVYNLLEIKLEKSVFYIKSFSMDNISNSFNLSAKLLIKTIEII